MAKKSFRKVLSLFLAVCMIVSMFVCMSTTVTTVSAAGTDTKMLNFDGPTSYNSTYYPALSYMTSGAPIAKGTKYRFSLDWENVQNAAFSSVMGSKPTFMLKLLEGTMSNGEVASGNYYDARYYVSGYTETVTELNNGVHIDIDFTYTGVNPSSGTVYTCPDNSELVIALGQIGTGDYGHGNMSSYSYPMKFNTANWVLYRYDNDQLVNTNAIKSMDAVSATNGGSYDNTVNGIHSVSNAAATKTNGDGYIGLKNSATDRDVFWLCSSYTWRATFKDIPTGYFNVPSGSEYDEAAYSNQGDSKTARFVKGEAASLKYYNNNRLYSKDVEYQVTFECNMLEGDGLKVAATLGGDAQTLEGSYNTTDKKWTGSFTASKESADFTLEIGTSDGSTHMLVAKPAVYAYNEDDFDFDTTLNYIHDIAANTIETLGDSTVGGTTNKLWNRVGGSDSDIVRSVRALDYSSVSPSNIPETKRITFKHGAYSVLRYQDFYNAGIVAGTTYKITLDYRSLDADGDVSISIANVSKSNASLVIDNTNRKAYYTFTATSNADNYYIDICNNEKSMSIGHVKMMALDENGAEVGTSLIDDINAMTLNINKAKVNNKWPESDRCWNTRGISSDPEIVRSSIPTGYFAENTDADKAVYFPSGKANNYQVLAYKDTDIYVPAGTYRVIIDENGLQGNHTVTIRKGTEIQTEISKTLISSDGYTNTYEFTLSDAATGFGMMIGNYGNGVDTASAFKNVVVKKYVDGELVGPNLVEPMNERTMVVDTGITRKGCESLKWSTVGNDKAKTYVQMVDVDRFFPGAFSTTGDALLVGLNRGATWRQLQYHDESLQLKKDHTYQFTINQKELGESNSTFSIALNTDVGKNVYNNSDYMTDCTDSFDATGTIRTVTFTMVKDVYDVNILLGNNSSNADCAVVYANPKLVDVNGSSANLIAGMTSDTVSFTLDKKATNRMWTTRGYASSGTGSSFFKNTYDSNYFTTPVAKMLYISKATTEANSKFFSTTANLEAGATYTLELDWRAYAGAIPYISITPTNKDNTNTFASSNVTGAPADNSGTNNIGHYVATFTMADNAKDDGLQNFVLGLGGVIKDYNFVNYGRGDIYFGNITLKKSGSDKNILINSDFSMQPEIQFNDSKKNSVSKWELSPNKVITETRNAYDDVRTIVQPANFFTNTGATAEGMMQFNGGSYDYILQSFVLKSDTKYRISYKCSYVNGIANNFLELIDNDSKFTSPTLTKNTYSDEDHTKTMEFTTLSNMRTVKDDNFRLSFLIAQNGSDVSFYFGDVKLYELDGDTPVGPNLVNNGGLNFGTDTVKDLYQADKEIRSMGSKATIGWQIKGSFEKNTSVSVVPLTAESFPSYIPYSDRLALIVNMILGKTAIASTGYTDLDSDGNVTVADLVKTKKKIANPSGVNVDDQASTWRKSYLTGDNATDLAALKNANMLAKDVTGTTYYVDASAGNDSNNGTSESTAWKSLAKVNSASLSSGDAVLFKCGEVFRPASVQNSDALVTVQGVTYGSYGSGAKPVITGSLKNYKNSTWTNESGNIWYLDGFGTHTKDEIGIVVYNYGSSVGDMKLKKSDLAKNGDFFSRGPDDSISGKLYIYCDSNPSTKYNSIEIGQNQTIIGLSNDTTINNICVKYTGKHGIEGTNNTNVAISNCQVSYIGGCYGEKARLGNGVQFGLSAKNCRVKNCYVTECFDAGLTFQDWNTGGKFESINFSNNLVENCNYAIEWFGAENGTSSETTFNGIYMVDNILRGAGYGWSYDERVGYETNYTKETATIGILQTSLFRVGSDRLYTKLTDMYIYNNTFDRSKGGLVYWYWNKKLNDGTLEEDVQNGLHIYNNNFYQAESVDNQILCFDKEGFVHGISTYGVVEGAKRFENTDTPTGKCKYIYYDERVIDNT